ncbi:MAG: NYN domain-containing protein, partial [Erysipelotrichaceae bacterium]|nr:NYN domain-containing protein [Erysipelotrichaceae bacterium]
VSYDEVEQYMHLKLTYEPTSTPATQSSPRKYTVSDEELKRVVERIHGPKREKPIAPKKVKAVDTTVSKPVKPKKKCVLVDGYNMIHAWKELKELPLDGARDRLIDMLSSYQGYKKCLVIVVFDAYKVEGNIGQMYFNGNIHIVYTKTAQTADSYIELASHELSKDYQVTVATSDGLEQIIVFGQGAIRISAREFEREIQYLHSTHDKNHQQTLGGHYPLADLRKLNDE